MTHAEQIRDCILYDTDPRFTLKINRYGCRVFALLAIPQFVTGRCLTVQQTLDIVKLGRRTKSVIINKKMRCGKEEHLLIDWAFNALGARRTGWQVGWDPEHITTRTWQYMIGHWETAGADGHFTLFDRGHKEIYDPHDADQAGYKIDKRRITQRLLYATKET